MLIILFTVMMIDYFLTYWGMNLGFIREGNPLMQWLMDMPLYYGVFVKAALCTILLIPLVIAGKSAKKMQKVALYISFTAYSVIFAMHGYWMYICLL